MTSQLGGVRANRVILVLVILVLAVAITLVSLAVVANTRDVERLSGPLPIDLPDTSELQNSPRKVFAHYFPPYPLSRDNESADVDYYTRKYLDPQGEGGRHAEYGGLLRERPLPVPVGNADSWRLDNMKTEITRAGQAGIDGFSVDILSIDTHNWQQVETAVAAATQLDNGFEILLTPDADVLDVSPAALAEAIAELAKSPAVTRLADGRLVVSPFAPEKLGAGWWRAFLRIMETEHEETVALLPCFLNYDEGAWDSRPSATVSRTGGFAARQRTMTCGVPSTTRTNAGSCGCSRSPGRTHARAKAPLTRPTTRRTCASPGRQPLTPPTGSNS